MSGYTLRESAEDDLDEIATYTERTWGIEQRDKYLDALERRFEDAALRPHLGKNCDNIRKGYLSVREGRHIIFYQKAGEHIEIVRVLHESRNLKQAIEQVQDQHRRPGRSGRGWER